MWRMVFQGQGKERERGCGGEGFAGSIPFSVLRFRDATISTEMCHAADGMERAGGKEDSEVHLFSIHDAVSGTDKDDAVVQRGGSEEEGGNGADRR